MFYTLDYFIYLMIQIIFMSNAIQIFSVFPEKIKSANNNEGLEIMKRTAGYTNKLIFKVT